MISFLHNSKLTVFIAYYYSGRVVKRGWNSLLICLLSAWPFHSMSLCTGGGVQCLLWRSNPTRYMVGVSVTSSFVTMVTGHDEALCECQEGALWPPAGSGSDVEGAQEPQWLSPCGRTQGIPGEWGWVCVYTMSHICTSCHNALFACKYHTCR